MSFEKTAFLPEPSWLPLAGEPTLMDLTSYFFTRIFDLPPRLNDVKKYRGLKVAMPDGVILVTDHYAPVSPGPHPTILMRLPYGRRGFAAVARAYAERGFNVVIQACRGTEKSGGAFEPLANERADGLATIAWLKTQKWFDGRLGTTGPSYLGYAQWAIADAPEIMAMSTKVTSAEFRSVVFPSGAFHLGLWLSWLQTIDGLQRNPLRTFRRMLTGAFERRTARASLTLPLVDADIKVTGHEVPFWRHWFAAAIEDGPFWHALDHRCRIGPDTPPNHFVSGWYDFMVDQLLADYAATIAAGHRPYLTVSSGTHITNRNEIDNPVETIAWMRAHLMNDRSGLRAQPVHIHISGTNQWHDFDSFPPEGATGETWYLHNRGILSQLPAGPTEPRTYRYDPNQPTPNVGGAIFAFTHAGPVDNAPRETRADVLCFTSVPMHAPRTIIGNASIRLFARASLPHVDFFVRLCDVGTDGISINICDGLKRVTPQTPIQPDGSWALDFRLHATAHTFLPGHRLRLQVSSGAHPRYARNTGTADPIGNAINLIPVDVEIFADPTHPTALTLPVYEVE